MNPTPLGRPGAGRRKATEPVAGPLTAQPSHGRGPAAAVHRRPLSAPITPSRPYVPHVPGFPLLGAAARTCRERAHQRVQHRREQAQDREVPPHGLPPSRVMTAPVAVPAVAPAHLNHRPMNDGYPGTPLLPASDARSCGLAVARSPKAVRATGHPTGATRRPAPPVGPCCPASGPQDCSRLMFRMNSRAARYMQPIITRSAQPPPSPLAARKTEKATPATVKTVPNNMYRFTAARCPTDQPRRDNSFPPSAPRSRREPWRRTTILCEPAGTGPDSHRAGRTAHDSHPRRSARENHRTGSAPTTKNNPDQRHRDDSAHNRPSGELTAVWNPDDGCWTNNAHLRHYAASRTWSGAVDRIADRTAAGASLLAEEVGWSRAGRCGPDVSRASPGHLVGRESSIPLPTNACVVRGNLTVGQRQTGACLSPPSRDRSRRGRPVRTCSWHTRIQGPSQPDWGRLGKTQVAPEGTDAVAYDSASCRSRSTNPTSDLRSSIEYRLVRSR